jgi:predicted AAA+ superfamily ATPase
MVDICFNLTTPKLPHAQQAKYDVFKVYYKHTGPLTSSYGGEAQIAIHTGKLKAFHGALLEAAIADIFMKNGKKLYYFDRNTTLEADFLIKFNDKNTVVEVKEADNPKTKMIESMFENFGLNQAIKLSLNNVSYTKNIVTYPIYMAMFL